MREGGPLSREPSLHMFVVPLCCIYFSVFRRRRTYLDRSTKFFDTTIPFYFGSRRLGYTFVWRGGEMFN